MPFLPSFSLSELLPRLIVLLVAIPIHEWAHAWSAYLLGDDTASLQGRLTLNPLAHLDPIGSLMILMGAFGWGKPVPVNPYRLRINPRVGSAITAVAGPFSNFLMAMLLAIPFRLGLLSPWESSLSLGLGLSVEGLLNAAIQINLGLMLFNLLPVYPLDGEKVLVGVLPPRLGDHLLGLRRFGPFILMGLIALPYIFGVDLVGIVLAPAYLFLYILLLV